MRLVRRDEQDVARTDVTRRVARGEPPRAREHDVDLVLGVRPLPVDGPGRKDVEARGEVGDPKKLDPGLARRTRSGKRLGQGDRLHPATLRPFMRCPAGPSRIAILVLALLVAACGDSPVTSAPPATGAAPGTTSPTAHGSAPPSGETTELPGSPGAVGVDRPDLGGIRVALAPVAAGLDAPIWVSGDGSGRLFVAEQAGRVRIVANGEAL